MALRNNNGWSSLDFKADHDWGRKEPAPQDFEEKKMPIAEKIADKTMLFLELMDKHQLLTAKRFSFLDKTGVRFESSKIDELYSTLKNLSISNPMGYSRCYIRGESELEAEMWYPLTVDDLSWINFRFFEEDNGLSLELNLSYILPVMEEHDDDILEEYITWQGRQSKLIRQRFADFFKDVEQHLGWTVAKTYHPESGEEPCFFETGAASRRVFAEGDWFYITREHLEDAIEVFEVKDDIREYLSPSQLVEYWEEQAAARIARMRAQGERRALLQREVWQIEQWEALRTAVRSDTVRALLAALPKTPVDPLLKAEIQGAGEEKLQLLAGVLR